MSTVADRNQAYFRLLFERYLAFFGVVRPEIISACKWCDKVTLSSLDTFGELQLPRAWRDGPVTRLTLDSSDRYWSKHVLFNMIQLFVWNAQFRAVVASPAISWNHIWMWETAADIYLCREWFRGNEETMSQDKPLTRTRWRSRLMV